MRFRFFTKFGINGGGVTGNAVRFNYTLVGLDEELVELVSDDCFYRQLKEQLIKCLSINGTAKLNHLPTPRALLHELKQLGDDKVGTELLQSL